MRVSFASFYRGHYYSLDRVDQSLGEGGAARSLRQNLKPAPLLALLGMRSSPDRPWHSNDLGALKGRFLADQTTTSEGEGICLDALREATSEIERPMEQHSLRVFLIAQRLATGLGHAFDREATLCASLLHDIGLYPRASEDEIVYLQRCAIQLSCCS